MPAPGGDFLARMFLGSDKVDELDYRNQAAARAYKAAGREFRVMRNGEALSPSDSRYTSSDRESTPVPLQRRGTAGHGGGGRDTYGGGGLARRADTEGERYSTRAGAGRQSQKLMMDPYGVGHAASPRCSTRQRHVIEGSAGHSSKQADEEFYTETGIREVPPPSLPGPLSYSETPSEMMQQLGASCQVIHQSRG
ncbi:MAG: hypothetical protein Q9173_006821 [Seirophora scorigena]